VSAEHLLVVAAGLFALGAAGALVRRNLLVLLLSAQLMSAAGILACLTFARLHGDVQGQLLALAAIAVAAVQLLVGVSLLVARLRNRSSVDADDVSLLKW